MEITVQSVFAPSCFSPRNRHDRKPSTSFQHHLRGTERLDVFSPAEKPLEPSEHHLCGFLPPQTLSSRSLHCVLPAYLRGVHGGKRGGVFHCAAQQEHAHRHQPVHPQPCYQRPAGWDLLHADHTGGQHHNR